jgi:ABC-2 type transport system permease protein
MNAPAVKPPLLPSAASALTPAQALRRLFLLLFLRGRGARGLKRTSAPKSVGEKLLWTLLIYLVIGGMFSFSFIMTHQPVFALAVYLHAMTFAFLGLFVASSAGEILFNKEEADILMHRPIDSRTMLWSKIRVLVEVSLWVAGAFNLVGLFAGFNAPDGGWRFPIVHAVSTILEALFCTGCVVLVYQLCLRWFGRERLEGLMTTTQILVSVGAVLSGQLLPRIVFRFGRVLTASESSWWIGLLPPAWFAGFDDALAGSAAPISWLFGGIAVAVTMVVVWLAFDKLAENYETGLMMLNETVTKPKPTRHSRRWFDWLVNLPPLSWWLRDPVSRASFLLTTAYLIRDRDVKLRVFPSIASMLVLPFIFLLQRRNGMGEFGVAFSGSYLGLIPLMTLSMLQYSQQWQAADIFRAAPVLGPAAICHGARRAVLCLLTLPVIMALGVIICLFHDLRAECLLFLPGIVALPVYSLVPGLIGKAVPLSSPIEEAKSAGRAPVMIVVMFVSMGLAGLTLLARSRGWFWQFLLVETVIACGLYAGMRIALGKIRWPSAE